ncbi:MAG TPA: ATP-binding protein [Candidatus Krumholzibacteria bacterium]|nr:ATP-binding protein [Candidatus Krumholzibacteria bacterium]HPD70946.1 ATP-binding protein [Candidatus Krumholzibacteria bacterium]HRY39354.1 ATP-binding protein [Candidatus Krumholzibacteria bacterium]
MTKLRPTEEVADLARRGLAACRVPQLIVDEQWTVVLVSEGACRLFGRSREQMEGTALESLVSSLDVFAGCGHRTCPPEGCFRQLDLKLRNATTAVELHCERFRDAAGHPFLNLVLYDAGELATRDAMRTARISKLGLLNQVSEALYGAQLSLPQVLESVLIAMTAGQGLRFNRAFLLLVDERTRTLRGEIAIGPSSREEADRIWRDLADQPTDLYEMMTSYDLSLKETDVAVNNIVRNLKVDLAEDDHVLIQAMHSRRVLHVSEKDSGPGLDAVRHWLGVGRFAVAPLATRRGSIGVLIADNAISGLEITELDLEFLQLFANQSANAIESSRLTEELARKVLDLRKAQQKQKEDQQTLLRMERLSVMGETSAIVAHELRNPLVAIGGFARTLLRNLTEDDPNRQFAQIITEEVGRLERIIHDLLDFIRPQKMMRRNLPPDQIVQEIARKMHLTLEHASVALDLDLKAGDVEVNCHPGEIQQVLQNLTLNAIQAQPDGGRIRISSRVLEGGVLIQVADRGPGLAKDVAEKMFSPFFTTKTAGSGLGLTICVQIIRAHGGVLRGENLPEGGACFSFILPRPKPEGENGE